MCMDVHIAPGIYCQLAPSTQLFEAVVDIPLYGKAELEIKI